MTLYIGYTRPWTPSTRNRIAVKRMCNGCKRALGDPTDADLEAAMAGRPLPDVTEECGCNWDQPPGVRQDADPLGFDGRYRPPPAAAAERILEFVKDFGDGRVAGHPDQDGVEPLYARDLEALAKAYLKSWEREHQQKASTP